MLNSVNFIFFMREFHVKSDQIIIGANLTMIFLLLHDKILRELSSFNRDLYFIFIFVEYSNKTRQIQAIFVFTINSNNLFIILRYNWQK
jgi:hypothetical protein